MSSLPLPSPVRPLRIRLRAMHHCILLVQLMFEHRNALFGAVVTVHVIVDYESLSRLSTKL